MPKAPDTLPCERGDDLGANVRSIFSISFRCHGHGSFQPALSAAGRTVVTLPNAG